MAIQLPNPGLGDGQTGDNEFVMWTKVKDNFSNTTHAASRLVGTATGNLLESGVNGIAGAWDRRTVTNREKPSTLMGTGLSLSLDGGDAASPFGGTAIYCALNLFPFGASNGAPAFHRITMRDSRVYVQQASADLQSWAKSAEFYTTGNTTKDTATGFLKASSPVLHVYNDSITKIHEAEQLDITVDKKGTGHYEIHGTTGLRKNDGWFMSPPRDLHGNVLCMIDVTEKDGVVILKTYKRKFDLELAAIVHDWDNPIDIPEGACVEFRFNDLPQELTNEPIE